ncbi:MAG: type II CAAX endopeptidase family protein [Candidatus Acidiferrales bacterium]
MTPDIEATHLDAHAGDIVPAQSSRSPIANIFMGPNGIRAGWRLLLFVVFWLGTILAIQFVVLHIPSAAAWLKAQDPHVMTPQSAIASEAMMLTALIVATLLMTLIEKRTYADYFFPLDQAFAKRFWQGVPYGFAMLSLLMVLIAAFRGFSLGSIALSGADALKFGAAYGVVFIMVGLFEEFSFRGYMQSTLTPGIGFWPAAIVLSILFGAIHLQNGGEAWIGAVMAGSFGILAAFSLKRTGNIWFPIGMHAAWDWGETYFYSVPDSGFLAKGHLLNSTFHGPTWLTGGTVGPEGSVFALVVLVIGGIGIHFLFPAKRATI